MAEKQDMTHANSTFGTFAGLMKWGTILSIIAVAFVILIIS